MTVNLVAAGRQTTEVATVIAMAGVIFDSQPTRTLKPDVAVLLERTREELPAIQQLWPRFEHLVGLRGRRMYAMVDIRALGDFQSSHAVASRQPEAGYVPWRHYIQ